MVLGSQKLQSTPDQNPRNPDVPDDRCRWVDIHLWSHDGWRGVVLEAGRYSAARCRWDALCLDEREARAPRDWHRDDTRDCRCVPKLPAPIISPAVGLSARRNAADVSVYRE